MSGELSGSKKIGGVHIEVGVKGAEQAQAELKGVGATAENMGSQVSQSASVAAGTEGGTTGIHGVGTAAKSLKKALAEIVIPAVLAQQLISLIMQIDEATAATENMQAEAAKAAGGIEDAFGKIARPSLGELKDQIRDVTEKASAAINEAQLDAVKKIGKNRSTLGRNPLFEMLGLSPDKLGLTPSDSDIQDIADYITNSIERASKKAKERLRDENLSAFQLEIESEETGAGRQLRDSYAESARKANEREAESIANLTKIVELTTKLREENDKVEESQREQLRIQEQIRQTFLNSVNTTNLGGSTQTPAVLTEIRNELRRINLNTRN